jgi:hypothetical protein
MAIALVQREKMTAAAFVWRLSSAEMRATNVGLESSPGISDKATLSDIESGRQAGRFRRRAVVISAAAG